ncbi:MAG: DUF4101 domain-containing protein [Leptolyngbyaceae cyanobacterium CRU_2_3]|nr:DUF4101 domain-containing protein [Leptolyngbyaceae cyanobacterium CRU_2_3]
MGESHDTTQLDRILAEPMLSQWKADAEQVKAGNSYLKYEHSNLQVTSVKTDESTADTSAASSTAEGGQTDGGQTGSDVTTTSTPSSEVLSSPTDAPNRPERATVEATITEKIESYTNGRLDSGSITPDNLRIRYYLTRQDGEWQIESVEPF